MAEEMDSKEMLPEGIKWTVESGGPADDYFPQFAIEGLSPYGYFRIRRVWGSEIKSQDDAAKWRACTYSGLSPILDFEQSVRWLLDRIPYELEISLRPPAPQDIPEMNDAFARFFLALEAWRAERMANTDSIMDYTGSIDRANTRLTELRNYGRKLFGSDEDFDKATLAAAAEEVARSEKYLLDNTPSIPFAYIPKINRAFNTSTCWDTKEYYESNGVSIPNLGLFQEGTEGPSSKIGIGPLIWERSFMTLITGESIPAMKKGLWRIWVDGALPVDTPFRLNDRGTLAEAIQRASEIAEMLGIKVEGGMQQQSASLRAYSHLIESTADKISNLDDVDDLAAADLGRYAQEAADRAMVIDDCLDFAQGDEKIAAMYLSKTPSKAELRAASWTAEPLAGCMNIAVTTASELPSPETGKLTDQFAHAHMELDGRWTAWTLNTPPATYDTLTDALAGIDADMAKCGLSNETAKLGSSREDALALLSQVASDQVKQAKTLAGRIQAAQHRAPSAATWKALAADAKTAAAAGVRNEKVAETLAANGKKDFWSKPHRADEQMVGQQKEPAATLDPRCGELIGGMRGYVRAQLAGLDSVSCPMGSFEECAAEVRRLAEDAGDAGKEALSDLDKLEGQWGAAGLACSVSSETREVARVEGR